MSHIWCLLHVIACISLQYYINLQFCRASLMYTYENAIKYVFEILNINLEIRSTSLSRIRWISIYFFWIDSFTSAWVHPQFLVGSVLLLILVFCVVLCFCVVFVYVPCLVCPMLSVFLNSPFLIAASVFSNILFYLLT